MTIIQLAYPSSDASTANRAYPLYFPFFTALAGSFPFRSFLESAFSNAAMSISSMVYLLSHLLIADVTFVVKLHSLGAATERAHGTSVNG